jgi:hypothetical protein
MDFSNNSPLTRYNSASEKCSSLLSTTATASANTVGTSSTCPISPYTLASSVR